LDNISEKKGGLNVNSGRVNGRASRCNDKGSDNVSEGGDKHPGCGRSTKVSSKFEVKNI
jgi:hypothetical protein